MSPQNSLSNTKVSATPSDPGDELKKKFTCTWQGCGKAFSRSEHLHRHALNHKEGNNTCSRCAAHFRRRDLLDRHMLRHKEKDDEAGGEGLGHLATRKRLWRDTHGNIVNARRPRRQEGVKRQHLSSAAKSAETAENVDSKSSKIRTTSQSPSNSILSAEQRSVEQYGGHRLVPNTWGPESSPGQPTWAYDSSDFLCNADWGNQPYQNDVVSSCDLPYDDIFKPDTAMSFNAPFTTLGYYSWLFENDSMNNTDGAMVPVSAHSAAISLGGNTSTIRNEIGYSVSAKLLAQNENRSVDINIHNGGKDNMFTFPTTNSGQELTSLLYQHNHHSQRSATPLTGRKEVSGSQSSPAVNNLRGVAGTKGCTPSMSTISDASAQNFSNGCNSATISVSSGSHDWSPSAESSLSQISSLPDPRLSPSSGQPLPDACMALSGPGLPLISAEGRDGLMLEISQCRPCRPDGSVISSSDPLLSLSSLQHYSDLFFTRFNSSYPLIHQATFDSDNMHNFLLMSILLLGATYSDKEAHLLAVCIHDIMRPLIHSSKEFSTRPKLWMLQTILLVECFGKSRAGEKQHDMSHLYHGLLINLIRRSDCQSAYVPPYDAQTHDLEEHWRLAVEAEQKRRLAMLCFMWDTQHAVLFSQSLCMNASELKLSLPWDNAVWEAANASAWLRLSRIAPPPPQYLSILKMYTNPSTSPVPFTLNALSRVLIFHGLMSISWDLNRRDQTSLSLSITSSAIPWQLRMAKCYAYWKSDFEAYSSSVLNSLSFNPKHQAKFLRFSVANMAVYHTAQLILNVDIIDLQIHAGARHIIGRPVTDIDRARSRAKIEEWMKHDAGKSAGTATWHAARLFRDGVRKLENWNVDEMFHYPWCLYLASLMCWALHTTAIQGSPPSFQKPESGTSGDTSLKFRFPTPSPMAGEETVLSGHIEDPDDEDGDWDARAEMNALISALTKLDLAKDSFVKEIWEVGRRFKTQGLLRNMAKQLNTVRWAVVREGMIVLKGLVH